MVNFISEDQIEQALRQRLQHECASTSWSASKDEDDLNDGSDRTDKRQAILRDA